MAERRKGTPKPNPYIVPTGGLISEFQPELTPDGWEVCNAPDLDRPTSTKMVGAEPTGTELQSNQEMVETIWKLIRKRPSSSSLQSPTLAHSYSSYFESLSPKKK